MAKFYIMSSRFNNAKISSISFVYIKHDGKWSYSALGSYPNFKENLFNSSPLDKSVTDETLTEIFFPEAVEL